MKSSPEGKNDSSGMTNGSQDAYMAVHVVAPLFVLSQHSLIFGPTVVLLFVRHCVQNYGLSAYHWLLNSPAGFYSLNDGQLCRQISVPMWFYCFLNNFPLCSELRLIGIPLASKQHSGILFLEQCPALSANSRTIVPL
jgi:hypothetical protein